MFYHCILSRTTFSVLLLGQFGCATPLAGFTDEPGLVQTTEESEESNEDILLTQSSNWNNAKMLHEIEGHQEEVTQLAFSPNGQYLASASADAIKVWNVDSGELLQELAGHESVERELNAPVSAIAFSPDSQTIATASWSQGLIPQDSIILWDVETGTPQQQLAGQEGCRDLEFTTDGGSIWAACGRNVQLWNVGKGAIEKTIGERAVSAIALSPNDNTLATIDANFGAPQEESNKVKLWNVGGNDTQIGTLSTTAVLQNVTFTPDGEKLITQNFSGGSSSGEVTIWDWQQNQSLYTHQYFGASPVQVSPDGSMLAGGFQEGLLVDLEGNPIENNILIRQQGGASAISFSQDHQTLAWSGKPTTYPSPIIRIWQAGTPNSDSPENNDDRANYESLELPSSRTTENPETFAEANYGLEEKFGATEETITSEEIQANQKVVTVTQTNLKDDSVGAMQYRLEFEQHSEGTWELTWVGHKQQCRRGPTEPNEWTTELCV
ncbi:MAG: WD40 repeat domain-containing protein [Halothece sp.]